MAGTIGNSTEGVDAASTASAGRVRLFVLRAIDRAACWKRENIVYAG
jgi:hypothetical protein